MWLLGSEPQVIGVGGEVGVVILGPQVIGMGGAVGVVIRIRA